MGSYFIRVLQKIHSFLFKDMSRKEIKKFGILSAAFFFIIGGYWIIRPLKNAILKDTIGVYSIPAAKQLSVLVMIFVLLLYSKLIDKVGKRRLFYIVCTFYAASFFVIAYFISFPHLINRFLLGFGSYALIESFGALVVAMFWSYVALMVDVDSAKRGYAIVFASGQVGAILGTTLVRNTDLFGIPFLVCMSGVATIIIPGFIRRFVEMIRKEEAMTGICDLTDKGAVADEDPNEDSVEDSVESAEENEAVTLPEKKTGKTGLFEGLKLLVTRPYVLGIFLIVGLYEVVVTIFDFQMQILASETYGTASYAAFLAYYGQLATLVACAFAFLGTRFFIRKLGFRVCLAVFPLIVGGLVLFFYFVHTLWVALVCMVTIKSLSYGFNNPIKEMVYIPTSDAIKFKAKGWIDMFGKSLSKGGGASISNVLKNMPSGFMMYGVLISLSLVGAWFFVAMVMGGAFTRLVRKKGVIE